MSNDDLTENPYLSTVASSNGSICNANHMYGRVAGSAITGAAPPLPKNNNLLRMYCSKSSGIVPSIVAGILNNKYTQPRIPCVCVCVCVLIL